MGLDGVELVMRVEDEFGLTIEDREAESLFTPRQLVELVMVKVGRTDHAVCLTQRAFHRVRRTMMRHLTLPRAAIRSETSMEQLIPPDNRRRILSEMLVTLEIADAMPLVCSQSLHRAILATALIAGGLLAWGVFGAGRGSESLLLRLLSEFTPFLVGAIGAGIAGFLGFRLTRHWQIYFPPNLASVGHFTRWVMARTLPSLGAPPGQWSREQVAARVREIVVAQLGCDATYSEDARFVEDLGLG